MKKIYLVFSLNVYASLIIAQTAITLGNSNMPGGGDTLRFTNVSFNSVGNYTQTGTNYKWDFGTVSSGNEGLREFKKAISTPYFLFFLASGEYGELISDTLVGGTGSLSITNYYNFYKQQTTPVNAFVADGAGMSISGIPLPSYYSDKDELYHFPMSYPKYDSTTFKFSTLSTTLIPIQYKKAGYRVTTVDGWGTITTPYGTENCLRLVTTQYSKDTTIITIPVGNLPPIKIGLNNYTRSYQWMTLSSKIPYFEVTGNLIGNTFTPTQARYRGYELKKELTGISEVDTESNLVLYPNPAHNTLYLSNTNGYSSIDLFSVNGQFMKTIDFNPFKDAEALDISDLANGVYILKCSNNKTCKQLKFVKD